MPAPTTMPADVLGAETRQTIRRLGTTVRKARRSLRISWLKIGAGLFVGLTLLVLLTFIGFDLLLVLPDWARWLGFAAVLGMAAWTLTSRVFGAMIARLTTIGAALRIERETPDMHNRLITVIDLSSKPTDEKAAPFFNAVVAQTAERMTGFRTEKILDRESLRRALWWAIVPAMVLAGAWAAAPAFVGVAVHRVLAPWADVPPASLLSIVVEPGDARILAGEAVTIQIRIEGGAPEEIRLQLKGEDGAVRSVPIRGSEGVFSFAIEAMNEPLRYRIFAGRTWTREYHLDRRDRPTLDALKLSIRPPAYAKNAPIRSLTENERTISVVEGSEIQAEILASLNTTSSAFELAEESLSTKWETDPRTIRWLIRDDLPEGAWPNGPWKWDWSQKFHRTHHSLPQEGEHRHGLGFNPPIALRPDDVFIFDVWIDPKDAPQQLMLEWNDGGWEHRAYWGDNRMKKPGAEGTPANRRMGDLPPLEQWIRLEVPAADVGLGGKMLREMAFCTFGGAVRWDWLGLCTGRKTTVIDRKPLKPVSLEMEETGRWSGRLPIDRRVTFSLQLRDDADVGNQNPDVYRVLSVPDKRPHLRVDQPGKDVVLSKPADLPLAAGFTDDVALDRAEVRFTRQRDSAEIVHPIWKAERFFDSHLYRGSVPKAVFAGANPGEVFTYRVRIYDAKGQSTDSPDFRVTFQSNDPSALDKRQERFDENKKKLSSTIKRLAAEEEKIAKKTAEIAQKYRPADAPKSESKKDPDSKADRKADLKEKSSKKKSDAAEQADTKEKSSSKDNPSEKPTGKDAENISEKADNKSSNSQDKSPDKKASNSEKDPTKAESKNSATKDAKSLETPNKSATASPAPQVQPPPKKEMTASDRKELRQLMNEQRQVEKDVREAVDQFKKLLTSPEAAAAPSDEHDALSNAARDLERNAAPDARTAAKRLSEATAENKKPLAPTRDAEKGVETVKEDLNRVVEKLQRIERLKQLASNGDDEHPEFADLKARQEAEEAAARAAEELEAGKRDLNQLRKEVDVEQRDQDRLAQQTDSAKNKGDVDRVENQQSDLERRARDTLQDVQEALEDPENANGENEGEAMDEAGEKSADGSKSEPADGGEKAEGEAKKEDAEQAASTPGGVEVPKDGADKANEKTGNDQASNDSSEKGSKQKPGTSKSGSQKQNSKNRKSGPQFESLKKKGASSQGKSGADQNFEDSKSDLEGRQKTLERDLKSAAKAIDAASGKFSQTMQDIKDAMGDMKKSSDLLSQKDVQNQMAMAKQIQNLRGMRGMSQQGDPKGRANDPRGMGKAAQDGVLGKDPTLADGIAGMKLQSRDRQELLQGAKAPTPESYKAYVRDYYNRLTETKSR